MLQLALSGSLEERELIIYNLKVKGTARKIRAIKKEQGDQFNETDYKTIGSLIEDVFSHERIIQKKMSDINSLSQIALIDGIVRARITSIFD